MSQNAVRLAWMREEVDVRLYQIMKGIHDASVRFGNQPDGRISYNPGSMSPRS